MPKVKGECPIVDWFQYRGSCKMKTCKFHTNATPRGCIAQDHRFPAGEKPITDAELLLYKFRDVDDLTIRNVSVMRKRSIQDARQYILLYHLIVYIVDQHSPDKGLFYTKGTSDRIDAVLASKRLRKKRLGFETWMLSFILDESVHKAFCIEKRIELSSLSVASALDLKPKEYKALCESVSNLGKIKPLFS